MRIFVVVAAVGALSACYPEPRPNAEAHPLSTTCGLVLETGDETDLANLQRQQDITLVALSSVTTNVRWTPEVTCGLLEGTYVQVEPLPDGRIWSDDQFFQLKGAFDRGRYSSPFEVVVTTYDWSNPELSWQLVRVITRGGGDPDDLLYLTGPALAEAAKLGRQSPSFTLPLDEER